VKYRNIIFGTIYNNSGQLPFYLGHLIWIIARPKRRITIKDLEFLNDQLSSTIGFQITINDLNFTNKHTCILSSNVGMTKTVEYKIKNNSFIKYIHIPKDYKINEYTLRGLLTA